MKKCSKCNSLKDEIHFDFRDKKKGKRHSICKNCKSEWHKTAMNNGRREKIKNRNTAYRNYLKNFVVRYKRLIGCKNCGEKRHYVLDLHHKHDKDEAVSNLIRKSPSMLKLKSEIKKCDVLCSNCHREYHYLEKKLT